ncbi:unnamed protein product [Prorocentrum cordatum]|uniref:J domain-containing protein n=1 Tax=Prorocentrum cordatum TaxID=2364126 RepID=A0ABN9T8F5_9DINO|nr:unnamed protein product [Polarella glacialis]
MRDAVAVGYATPRLATAMRAAAAARAHHRLHRLVSHAARVRCALLLAVLAALALAAGRGRLPAGAWLGAGRRPAAPEARGRLAGARGRAGARRLCARRAGGAGSANPYDVLGLPRTAATSSEVRAAFREMAKLYHPDVPGTGDSDRFLAAREAADALATPEGRAKWARQQPRAHRQRRRERAEAQAGPGFWAPRAAAEGRRGGRRPGGGPSRPHSWVDAWEEEDWMDEDDLEDAEAWDVEWGGGRRGEARWEGWAPWDDEDRGRRGGQQRGGRERRQGGGREDSLETQLKVAQEEAHRRHLDRERLWKEELGKARERAKETQKLGWSDQLSQLKADNYQRRGRERLRWALKTNQTRDEREAWKEAAAQRWVERFRLAEEESNRRREETARFYAEKIRRAREEARRLREERAALEEARLSKWEHLEKQLQEKSQRMWSDAFQEALRTNCDEQDEERHWAAFLEQAQQSQRSLPKKWSSRFFRLMQDHMDNHVAQTKFWERSFRKAMDFSSSKASEDAAFWQGQIRKANAKDFKQRAEINQKQLQQFRSHEKQAQQWKEREIQKWAKSLRKAEDDALRKERDVEREWAQKLLEAEEEALEVLMGK